MIKRLVLPVAIIVFALIVVVLLQLSKADAPRIKPPEKVWLVSAVATTFQTLSPEITLYGRVETPTTATLKSALEADVIAVDVLEGTEVQAGQTLVQLDDTDTRLLVEQRQADVEEASALIDSENMRFQRDNGLLKQQKQLLNLANKSLARAQKLQKSKLMAQSTLDDTMAAKQRQLVTLKQLQHDIKAHPSRLAQLKASHHRAKVLLEQAQVDQQRTTIKAPFSGRISHLAVAVGDRVRDGDSLLSLYDLDHLEVRAQIPGRYVGQVRQMLSANQKLTAAAVNDGDKLQFDLQRISGEVSRDSGGLDGLFKMQGQPRPLPLGTFIELHLKLAQQQQVVELPFPALYGLNKIYRVEKGYLQSLTIERVGEFQTKQGNKHLLVRSDKLKSGDQIVATQLPNAINGLRVKVLP